MLVLSSVVLFLICFYCTFDGYLSTLLLAGVYCHLMLFAQFLLVGVLLSTEAVDSMMTCKTTYSRLLSFTRGIKTRNLQTFRRYATSAIPSSKSDATELTTVPKRASKMKTSEQLGQEKLAKKTKRIKLLSVSEITESDAR